MNMVAYAYCLNLFLMYVAGWNMGTDFYMDGKLTSNSILTLLAYLLTLPVTFKIMGWL